MDGQQDGEVEGTPGQVADDAPNIPTIPPLFAPPQSADSEASHEHVLSNRAEPVSDPVVALTQALASFMRSSTIQPSQPQSSHSQWRSVGRKELSGTTWPTYHGEFKYFRRYKKDVFLALSLCSPGAADKVVP